MQDTKLADQIRETIENLLCANSRPRTFSHDQSLFISGLLDSISAIRLIAELETKFGLRMDASFTIQRLDSLDSILEELEASRGR